MSRKAASRQRPIKTRLSASLKDTVAREYAKLVEMTELGDSDLMTQGIIRMVRDVRREGRFVIETMPAPELTAV